MATNPTPELMERSEKAGTVHGGDAHFPPVTKMTFPVKSGTSVSGLNPRDRKEPIVSAKVPGVRSGSVEALRR